MQQRDGAVIAGVRQREMLPSPAGRANPKGAALLKNFIVEAISNKRKGDATNYFFIINELKKRENFRKWILGLTNCVSLLGNDCHEMIQAVLSYDWHDEATNEAFCAFLANLNSAQPAYLLITLQKLVQSLQFYRRHDQPSVQQKIDHAMNSCHQGIATLLSLIPSATSVLAPVLSDSFPHKKRDIPSIIAYTLGLLRMTTYCPVLRERILAIIVERLIQIDVEINLEESNPALSGSDDQTQFRLDEEQKEASTPSTQSDMVAKLDEMMDLMFEYVQSTLARSPEDTNPLFGTMLFAAGASPHWLFESLMRIFESLVLLTHKCKFTQFLIFFLCSRTPEYARSFLEYLTAVAVDAKRDVNTRLSCVAYLGSFLARANFLSYDEIRNTLSFLTRWLNDYTLSPSATHPDGDAHPVFYATCQSVFYTVVFQQHKLFGVAHKEAIASMRFEQLIYSRLNPLKVCFPSIVMEFSNVMRAREVMDLSALIEKNRRVALLSRSAITESEPFFPFDPYLLKKSSRHIEPLYNIWRSLSPQVDADAEANQSDSVPSSLSNTPADNPVPLLGINLHRGRSFSETDSPMAGSAPQEMFM